VQSLLCMCSLLPKLWQNVFHTLNSCRYFAAMWWAFIVLKICLLLVDMHRSVFDSSILHSFDWCYFHAQLISYVNWHLALCYWCKQWCRRLAKLDVDLYRLTSVSAVTLLQATFMLHVTWLQWWCVIVYVDSCDTQSSNPAQNCSGDLHWTSVVYWGRGAFMRVLTQSDLLKIWRGLLITLHCCHIILQIILVTL